MSCLASKRRLARWTRGFDAEQSPFSIAAAGAPSRPRCVLKQNDCFAVLDDTARESELGDEAGGLFARDTRHLSRLAFLINGQEPLLCGSTLPTTISTSAPI